ncbi:NUDIX domain-containing protein [Lacibacterium aquatile]|uniref:NUDIX domain-containing protein n=1 Tax=Lacibacterium aquatile TaxID=1168082 RepID=A0ABW5DPK2_9PROT
MSDQHALRYPVSVKAVLFVEGRCVLLKNERDEWELPGGKLEAGHSPEQTAIREVWEELGIVAKIDRILDSWIYRVNGIDVLIVTYLCYAEGALLKDLKISDEHKELRHFAPKEIAGLNMPMGYKRSIAAARE